MKSIITIASIAIASAASASTAFELANMSPMTDAQGKKHSDTVITMIGKGYSLKDAVAIANSQINDADIEINLGHTIAVMVKEKNS